MSGPRIDWAADRFGGILSGLSSIERRPHDPDVALCAGTVPRWGPRREPLAVGGAGWTDEEARLACVGEAVERLEPWALPRDGVVEGTADEVGGITAWVLFHPEQYATPGFPFRPFTRETRCRWVAFRTLEGERAWVPEEVALLHCPAHVVAPGTSTGLSTGTCVQRCLLRGVQECIERDALVGAWWGRYPLEAHDPLAAMGERAPRLLRPNLEWRCYRVATPFSAHATIATVAGEDREGFVFAAGSAVRETRAESFAKSLLEAVQGRHYVRWLRTQRPEPPPVPRDFAEHAAHYSWYPEQLVRTPFARATREARAAGGAEALRDLVPRLPAPPVLRNVTPPGVASELPEWVVLRVLVPGLQPLHASHALPHLGGPLWAPRGLADWRDALPHPFP